MKRKIERSGAGVSITEVEERVVPEDCIVCPFSPCCYKYIKPEICKLLKDEIDEEVEKRGFYQSPPEESIDIFRVLSVWDWKNGYKEYVYKKVKSVVGIGGYYVVSVEPATKEEWENFQLQEEER